RSEVRVAGKARGDLPLAFDAPPDLGRALLQAPPTAAGRAATLVAPAHLLARELAVRLPQLLSPAKRDREPLHPGRALPTGPGRYGRRNRAWGTPQLPEGGRSGRLAPEHVSYQFLREPVPRGEVGRYRTGGGA